METSSVSYVSFPFEKHTPQILLCISRIEIRVAWKRNSKNVQCVIVFFTEVSGRSPYLYFFYNFFILDLFNLLPRIVELEPAECY